MTSATSNDNSPPTKAPLIAAKLVRQIIEAGETPIPNQPASKHPSYKGWNQSKFQTPEEFWAKSEELNYGPEPNITVLLHGGEDDESSLADSDLDNPSSLQMADSFLPRTPNESGRPGAPRSHRLTRTKLERNYKFSDPLHTKDSPQRASLLEISGLSQQATIYGKHKDTKERIAPVGEEWKTPAIVSADELLKGGVHLAVATVMVLHLPSEGGRHKAYLPFAGILQKDFQYTQADTDKIFRAVAETLGDSEVADRVETSKTTAEKLAHGEPVAGESLLAEIYGDDAAGKIMAAFREWHKWLGIDVRPASRQRTLLGMARERLSKLYITPTGQAYGFWEGYGLVEIGSAAFSALLNYEYIQRNSTPANSTDLREIGQAMAAIAQFEGIPANVYYRVGPDDEGNIWHDLGNGRYAKITRYKVTIETECPVLFRHEPGMQPLLDPKIVSSPSAGLAALQKFLALEDDADFYLAVGWLLVAMRPDAQYLMLQLTGIQGSGKTSKAQGLQRIFDPRETEISGAPKSEKDLYIKAHHAACLLFDNLTFIAEWLSDALCRMTTHGGFSDRKLYSDSDLVTYKGQRPIISTGISEVVYAGDLASRTITIDVPLLDDSKRVDEATLWPQFEAALPEILGAIYYGLSGALRNLGRVSLPENPRMMDAALWVEAAGEAFGWPKGAFVSAMAIGQKRAQIAMLESTAFGGALVKYLKTLPDGFEGTASKLLKEIERMPRGLEEAAALAGKKWPQTARAAGAAVSRLTPGIVALGGVVDMKRTSSERILVLRMPRLDAEAEPSEASSSNIVPFTKGDFLAKARGAE